MKNVIIGTAGHIDHREKYRPLGGRTEKRDYD